MSKLTITLKQCVMFDFLFVADEDRDNFMISLSVESVLTHTINRCDIINEVMALY